MVKKKTATKKPENGKPAQKATRLKILKAARKVFAQYAYHAASIRMIGKEAGIDHPLISYYFPSKANSYYAGILGIPANSRPYNQWVKEMLMELFLPRLKQLMYGCPRTHRFCDAIGS